MPDEDIIPDLRRERDALKQSVRSRDLALKLIHDLSSVVGQAGSYKELFDALLTLLSDAVPYDVAGALAKTPGGGELYLRLGRPITSDLRTDLERRIWNGYRRAGGETAHREVQTTRVSHTEQFVDRMAPFESLESLVQVPLAAGGATQGFLLIGSSAEGAFGPSHERLLEIVGGQVSSAVRRLQLTLAPDRRRLETIIQHLPDGALLLDRERRILVTNPAARRILEQFGHSDLGGTVESLGGRRIEECLDTPGDIADAELVVPGPPQRVYQPAVIPVDDEEDAAAWLLVLRDVTDARETLSRRDRFLALLAHELRNPLDPILNATRVLERLRHRDPVDEQVAGVIARQTQHLARLVDDLLDVSRFLHGKITLKKAPLNFTELVTHTAETHRPGIERSDRRFLASIDEEPQWVDGDPVRLAQVISNLLNNAVKYSSPGDSVILRCRAEEGQAVVSVRDTGIGITPDKVARIFDPFVQISDSTASDRGGLGLGLALVRFLVKKHGGSVDARSEGIGQGSEFCVRLPTVVPVEQDSGETPAVSIDRCRVLIVEDSEDARSMLQQLLQLTGHEVSVAASGPEGVEACLRLRPDVALVDIGLPGMNGYEVAESIRGRVSGEGPVLVALTGFAQSEDRARSREAGFDEHLVKPVDLGELERVLALAVQRGAPAAET